MVDIDAGMPPMSTRPIEYSGTPGNHLRFSHLVALETPPRKRGYL